jgi:hypothetical protein
MTDLFGDPSVRRVVEMRVREKFVKTWGDNVGRNISIKVIVDAVPIADLFLIDDKGD